MKQNFERIINYLRNPIPNEDTLYAALDILKNIYPKTQSIVTSNLIRTNYQYDRRMMALKIENAVRLNQIHNYMVPVIFNVIREHLV